MYLELLDVPLELGLVGAVGGVQGGVGNVVLVQGRPDDVQKIWETKKLNSIEDANLSVR